METCLAHISKWMCLNLLKLNQDKTELICLHQKLMSRNFQIVICHLKEQSSVTHWSSKILAFISTEQ